jgi:hypothetical protein
MSSGRTYLGARHFLLIVALWGVGACGDTTPTGPVEPTPTTFIGPAAPSGTLIQCRVDPARSASAHIGILGGVVSLGATKVVFPAGALLGLTKVTLTIPASPYVEIAIETDGPDYFPNFLTQPIVTIDYSHCNPGPFVFRRLTAWYIDASTKEPLERMLSVHNRITRTVTFTTSHFSGYAIAF